MLSAGHKSRPPLEIRPALVMPADQQIAVQDLGEAVSLDSQVRTLLSLLRSPVSDPTKSAKARYDQVLKPLLPPTARHLYLSLDGSLSRTKTASSQASKLTRNVRMHPARAQRLLIPGRDSRGMFAAWTDVPIETAQFQHARLAARPFGLGEI